MAPPIKRVHAGFETFANKNFNTIIDVRSPSEFINDHLPGAINLPVLNDLQRSEIGIMYKKVDPFSAKRAGAVFVAQNIAMHLQTVLKNKGRNWCPLIYCWRGGQRSAAMAQIFSNIGWHCAVVEGGYKAYRRYVLDCLGTLPQHLSLLILSGQTGTAKTHILRAASKKGAQVIDLERLANHRGSLLGKEPKGFQPSQRHFESQLCKVLQACDPKFPVFVEAESNKIGDIHIPAVMWAAMRRAPSLRVVAPMKSRILFLKRDYVHMVNTPKLIEPLLMGLKRRHNVKQLSAWSDMIAEAQWESFIQNLLEVHYDPSYQRSGNVRQENESELLKATTLCANDVERLANEMIAKSSVAIKDKASSI